MNRSRADKYIPPSGIVLVGGALILAPLFLKIPSDYQSFAAKESLRQSESINRDRIAQRKETADSIRKAGLIPEGKTLRLLGYLDGPKPPRIKKRTLQYYLADERVFVYDEPGTCIGRIENRKFIWKRESSTACEGAPASINEE